MFHFDKVEGTNVGVICQLTVYFKSPQSHCLKVEISLTQDPPTSRPQQLFHWSLLEGPEFHWLPMISDCHMTASLFPLLAYFPFMMEQSSWNWLLVINRRLFSNNYYKCDPVVKGAWTPMIAACGNVCCNIGVSPLSLTLLVGQVTARVIRQLRQTDLQPIYRLSAAHSGKRSGLSHTHTHFSGKVHTSNTIR